MHRGIAPRIDRETAWKRLHAGGFRLARWTLAAARRLSPSGRPGDQAGRELPCLELVWLPVYMGTITTRGRRGAPRDTRVTIGAADERPCVWREPPDLSVRLEATRLFEPALSADQARTQLFRLVNARPGSGRRVEAELTDIELVHHPYWVYYHERGRARLDVRLLDAVNGARTGPGIKIRFLEALA